MAANSELVAELNRLAQTTGLAAAGAANAWAGTTGLELIGALNAKAGNLTPSTMRELNGVCNQLAGTSGLDAVGALASLTNIYLSSSTGTSNVTSPTNEDGPPNGAVATCQTVPSGAATATLTGQIGSTVGTVSFTRLTYQGWFRSVNTLVTSTTVIKAHSSTAAFSDITMYSNAALNSNVNHLSGDFTFDLYAAGVNTLAKLQSLQIISSTTDAVAGVTPAVLTVDAGAVSFS